MIRIKQTFWLVAAAAVVAFGMSTAEARNQWGNYHWEQPSGTNQLTINVNDCQDGTALDYYNMGDSFSGPNADWDNYIGAAGGALAINDGACPASLVQPSANDPLGWFDSRAGNYLYDAATDTAGTVNTFNGNYGGNGWVGLAIISIEGNDPHILYGETYLNDYYPGIFAIYNQPTVMRKVQCQEVGHVFGLDHIKKDISCMYSSAAFIGAVYAPGAHDGDEINSFTHNHTAAPPPPDDGGGGPGDFCTKHPDHWKCQAPGLVFRGKATWAEHYDSDDAMFDAADAVVKVRVVNGSAFDRLAGAPGRELPVSQAVLRVLENLKGNANGVIRLEHTRGLGLEIVDDPGYVNGDEYLLYLRQTGAGTYRTVNPSGRIQQ